jgi:hypothetical protein
MRKNMAYYVAEAKRALGDAHMSDRALGEAFGYSTQLIQRAKCDSCTDPLAIRIAETIGEDPGEVLLVARAEREKDQVVKEHLLRYAGKALRLVPSRAASAVAAFAVALSAALSPDPAPAYVGGEGGIRTHVTA